MIKKSLGIGAGGALIASLCCVTPLIIVLFGLGSISFALGFTKYRSIFLISGFLFIGLAVFLNVKKKGKTCSIDPDAIKKKKKFIVLVAIAMIVFYVVIQYIILPYLGRVIYSG